MPTARHNVAYAATSSALYVIGGWPSYSEVEQYNAALSTWSTLPSNTNLQAYSAAAIVGESTIFVAGGYGSGECYDSFESYKLTTTVDNWAALSASVSDGAVLELVSTAN